MQMQPLIIALAVLGALLSSQIPEFTQQYLQRLAGAVDELSGIVQQFEEDSSRSGYDRAAALGVMKSNAARLVQDQATRMEENIARMNRLLKQQASMRDAGPLARFSEFLANMDGPLAQKTWHSFVPALPFSLEGAFFALIGFACSYVVIFLTIALFRREKSEATA
jgi:hypothetical protein